LAEVLGQSLQDVSQQARAAPLLKPPMARLIGRIPIGEIFPGRARAQDPEHAVQHLAGIPPRAPPPITAALRLELRGQDGPLLVGEVHAALVRRAPPERNTVRSDL